jgi:ATP-binding cassette subfamily B protein
VLLGEPALLVLDEATSALDTESERLVSEALQSALRGRTCIIIAHRLSTLRKANRLVVLDRGQVVEAGDHETLMASEGAYFRLYQAQVRQGDESDERLSHKVWRADEDGDG